MPIGPILIIISNLLLLCALVIMPNFFIYKTHNILTLGVANLILGVTVLIYWKVKKKLPTKDQWLRIIIWGICYSVIYSIYLYLPNLVSPSFFVLAETIAPYLGLFFAGKALQFVNSYKFHFSYSIPTIILVLLSLDKVFNNGEFDWAGISVLASLTTLQGLSQASARKLGECMGGVEAAMALSLFTGPLLIISLFFKIQSVGLPPLPQLFSLALLMAVIGLLAVSTFVKGLSTTPHGPSLPLISSIVPMSLISDYLLNKEITKLSAVLSVFFLISISISSLISGNKREA